MKLKKKSVSTTYAFIDASNLFYGGEKSLGWKIDYKKLMGYLEKKYTISNVYYFGGIEIHGYHYDYLKEETVPLKPVEKWLLDMIKKQGKRLDEAYLLLLSKHLSRIRFYIKLQKFGYQLFLKPVKLYHQKDGRTERKANCDVDMAFHLMKEKEKYQRVVILSGDGDFLPVLKYLKKTGKDVVILSRGARTAKEIRQFAGSNFRDFVRLEHEIKYEK